MSVTIAHAPIDLAVLRAELEDVSCGAAVFFEGRVRNHNEGKPVERLEYEVYEPLAVSEGEKIIAEAAQRWPLTRAVCVHRAGLLELGDIAVVVGVISAHRDAAYQASRYIIDEVKQRLPIWKKEYYADEEPRWVNCRNCAAAGHAHRHAGEQSEIETA